jgi:hypothetical protein
VHERDKQDNTQKMRILQQRDFKQLCANMLLVVGMLVVGMLVVYAGSGCAGSECWCMLCIVH